MHARRTRGIFGDSVPRGRRERKKQAVHTFLKGPVVLHPGPLPLEHAQHVQVCRFVSLQGGHARPCVMQLHAAAGQCRACDLDKSDDLSTVTLYVVR